MDIIFLHDLRIETVIGIWDWERKIRQTVAIDLEMSADIRKAAATDSVDDTLNYKLVAKRLQQYVGESSFHLVETLAEFAAESFDLGATSATCLTAACEALGASGTCLPNDLADQKSPLIWASYLHFVTPHVEAEVAELG